MRQHLNLEMRQLLNLESQAVRELQFQCRYILLLFIEVSKESVGIEGFGEDALYTQTLASLPLSHSIRLNTLGFTTACGSNHQDLRNGEKK